MQPLSRDCAEVMQSAPSFKIVKKLKLVGEPYKIFKHTAFVKKMFNSDLEVRTGHSGLWPA